MPPTMRWRVADPALVSRQWTGEDEAVVYSPRSGDVHLLNAAAHALLLAVSAEPQSSEQLAAHLADAAGRPADDELRLAVDESLARLDELGLIEPQVS